MTGSISADAGMQEKVFAFLMDPTTHPDVRRIDTHAASVFLEGTRALKIKRAVRFPYLDYSTLAKRKAACDEEMKINSQFAPQIYRRVAPITQGDDGSLSIDGDGVPIEFAIEMTRFDERQTIDHLAEAGEPGRDLVHSIADAIAASHAVAPSAPAEPWIKSIPAFIKNNATAFRTAACFPASDIDDLDEASQSAFFRVRGLLEQRGSAAHFSWPINYAFEVPLHEIQESLRRCRIRSVAMLQEAIVFLQSELDLSSDAGDVVIISPAKKPAGSNVVIGHGGSAVWRELRDFLRDRLKLPVDEFNAVAIAGLPTVGRLEEMLDGAGFAQSLGL
jgi:hypothetical protein